MQDCLDAEVAGKAVEMPLEDFCRPVDIATRTQFLTAKVVAPHMVRKGAWVIMMITANPARLAIPLAGGFRVAFELICGVKVSQCKPH